METPGISVFQLKVFQKSSSKGVMLRHRVSADYSLHPFKGGSTEVGFITVYFTHLKDIWIKLPKSYGIQWKEKSTSQWSLISGGSRGRSKGKSFSSEHMGREFIAAGIRGGQSRHGLKKAGEHFTEDGGHRRESCQWFLLEKNPWAAAAQNLQDFPGDERPRQSIPAGRGGPGLCLSLRCGAGTGVPIRNTTASTGEPWKWGFFIQSHHFSAEKIDSSAPNPIPAQWQQLEVGNQ